MDLDDLFGDGAELGDDVVVKAQLRFRVHPPKHPVAQDLVDRLVTAYDERVDMICEEIGDVLKHADLRRSARSQPLVLDLGRRRENDVQKAGQHVYAPGSKGGKWYRDGAGHIRYGEAPSPTFKQKASETDTTPAIGHYRPRPFMGQSGADRELTSFILPRGQQYGFRKPELRFLGAWYGTNENPGSLFAAFLDCAQLTPEDLKGDITQLRFGGQKLTYEEAVFEFFAAQRDLFMGDAPGGKEADAEWNSILNDQIRPMLDSVFSKYEALKDDEKFQQDFASAPNKLRAKFYANARMSDKQTRKVADHIIAGWDPGKQAAEVIAGLKTLGLLTKPSKVDNAAIIHDRPHLSGSVVPDEHLLSEHDNPLLKKPEKLAELTASQLMLLYVGGELHRRWDPETRSYSDEPQEDIGPGALGAAVFEALGNKSEEWATAAALARKHLDKVVDHVVTAMNHLNASSTKKK